MRRWLVGGVLAAAWLAGCQVQWISQYDEVTDRGITDIQRSIERHLGQLEALAAEPPGLDALTEQCRPERFTTFHEELDSGLRVLILRNEAREQNALTVEQLKLLQSSLGMLREQQRERYTPTDAGREIRQPGDRCLSAGQVQLNRRIIEQNIRAILKLELAKRDFRKEE